MPLSIRPVASAEDEAVRRGLVVRIFPERGVNQASFRRDGSVDYTAFLRDTPIGVGSILYGDPSDGGVTEIYDIGVAPEHRRAGFGRRLLMHLCAEACRIRPDQDRVITPHGENAPFYEMFGFVAEGEAPGDEEGPRMRMRQRALAAAPRRSVQDQTNRHAIGAFGQRVRHAF